MYVRHEEGKMVADLEMKKLLQKNQSDIALVIGNGINRYGSASSTNSWHDLLVQLAVAHLSAKHDSVPVGIALTEYYDVLDLTKTDPGKSLQKQFCELMTNWQYDEHHERIVKWAQKADVPILTTNFDQVLSDAGKCTLRRTKKGNFTDYYPWESYYGSKEISDPSREFGIWHVNGMQHYHRSIRLGLTHYMGSVTRAHKWLRKKNKRNLFSGKDVRERDDAVSWLQIVFNKPLMIFGLGLEENEVFCKRPTPPSIAINSSALAFQ
jgi:hypothetical protein